MPVATSAVSLRGSSSTTFHRTRVQQQQKMAKRTILPLRCVPRPATSTPSGLPCSRRLHWRGRRKSSRRPPPPPHRPPQPPSPPDPRRLPRHSRPRSPSRSALTTRKGTLVSPVMKYPSSSSRGKIVFFLVPTRLPGRAEGEVHDLLLQCDQGEDRRRGRRRR